MKIGLTLSRKENDFFIIHVFLILFTLIIFALWNRIRIKIILNRYLADPLARLTINLKDDKSLKHTEMEISEISYLIDQINNWKSQLKFIK